MGNKHVKPLPRPRNKKQVHWKAADRPLPPGKPFLAPNSDSTPELVTIRWTKPLRDGGTPITGYLVEHRRTGSPHWVRATPLLVPFPELTLSGLEPGWRYQFRVSAENVVGLSDPSEISEHLTITLKFAITTPKFTEELKDITVLENEKVEFAVYFMGQPAPKICWFKDGFEIFSSRRTRILTESDKSVLTIHQTALADEGEIKCTATNKAGHVSTKARLSLEAPPSIRLPRQYEDGLLFEIGEMVRLKVSVAGRPTPLVFWSHNGETIQNNDRYEIEHIDKCSVLKVGEARRSDRGEYQIKAVNKVGEHSASFLVTITDKPSPPGRARVVMTLGRSVTLSWNIPEDDGGCKIGNYIVEYYRLGWNVWLKAATCRQLTTILGDLIEGSEYRFRVKAESPYGVSEPSEESETIFIPDPRRGITSPQVRSRSQPKDFIDEFAPPPVSRKKEKPRSLSTTPSPNQYITYLDGDVPKRPERKIKSPPVTPEPSPKIARRESNSLHQTILDRASIARELAYGSPDIKFKKTEELSPTNIKTERSHSTSPISVEISYKPQITEDKKTPSPKPKRIISREDSENLGGSSEFMLVLYPDADEKGERKRLEFDLDYDSIPPPISLSAPELGAEPPVFDNLKLSASSTELLHERAMMRLNEAAAAEEAEFHRGRRSSYEGQRNTGIPKIQINSKDDEDIVGLERRNSRRRLSSGGIVQQQLMWAQRRFSLLGSNELNNLLETKLENQNATKLVNIEERKRLAMNREKSESEEREEIELEKVRNKKLLQGQSSFEKRSIDIIDEEKWLENYEESLSEEETESSSEDDRKFQQMPPIISNNDQEETYHPGVISNVKKTFSDQPFEILSKPNKLPDPNFVPKPILKKTDDKSDTLPLRDGGRELSTSPNKTRTRSPMPRFGKSQEVPSRQRSYSLAQPNSVLSQRKSNTFPATNQARQRSFSLTADADAAFSQNEVHKTHSISGNVAPGHNISVVAQLSGITAASIVIPGGLLNKIKDQEEVKVVADHYSEIVRDVAQRKRSIPQITPLKEKDIPQRRGEKDVYSEPKEVLDERRRGSITSSQLYSSEESCLSLTKEIISPKSSQTIVYNENVGMHSGSSTGYSSQSSLKDSSPVTVIDRDEPRTRNISPQGSYDDLLKNTSHSKHLNERATSPLRQTRSPTPQRGRAINHGPRKASKRSKTPSKSPALENWAGQRKSSSPVPQRGSPSPVPQRASTSPTPNKSSVVMTRKSPSPSASASRSKPLLREIMTQTSIGLELNYSYSTDSGTSSPSDRLARQEELMAKAEVKVKSAVDYATDLAMFIVACWLYLFSNELLAIPVLVIMVYRQLWDEIQRRIPRWILRRFKKTKPKKK